MANNSSISIQDQAENWQRLSTASKTIMAASGLLFTGAYAATYWAAPAAGQAMSTTSRILLAVTNTAIFAGGAHLTSGYSTRMIDSFTGAISPYVTDYYIDPETEKYLALLNAYNTIRPTLTENNRKVLDFNFALYKTWLYDVSNKEWRVSTLRNVALYLEYSLTALQHPNHNRTATKADINSKAAQLLSLLGTYPEQRDTILEFVKCMGYSQLGGQEFRNLRALCLEGPPGVGKTTLIQNICDIFDMNLVVLKGKSMLANDEGEWQFYSDFSPANVNPVARTLHNSNKLGFTGYTVILFDEIDKLPNKGDKSGSNLPTLQDVAQFLLDLTNNDQDTIRCFYSGLDYPKDRIIVILAVNEDILKLVPGLESRVDVILFKPMTPETKLEIALKNLQVFCQQNNVPLDDDVTQTVTTMAANNDCAGVRELIEDIRSLVYLLATNDFYEDTLLAKPKQQILNQYQHIIRCNARTNIATNTTPVTARPNSAP